MRIMDMTQGSPIRLLLSFSGPILIGNLFQQVYGLVDTMVAGHFVGDGAIAAIGATGALLGLIIDVAFGLNSGYAVIVTQRFGAKEPEKLKQAVAGTILLNLFAVVIITALMTGMLHPLLRFLQVPDAIYKDAWKYSFAVFAGIGATILFNMFSGILRAVGNSVTPLYFLVFSCLLNIVLDIWMVAGLKLGVTGAALATVAAQSVSAALSGRYLWKHYKPFLPDRRHFSMKNPMLQELNRIGCSMALMYGVVDVGAILLQSACNGLGEQFIIADIAASRIIIVLMVPLISLTSAASTFIGQNYGAKKIPRIRRGMWETAFLEMGWGALSGAVSFAFGERLIRLITATGNAEVIRYGVMKLNWCVPWFPLLGILFVLRISMQSMGNGIVPAVSSVLEMVIKGITAIWFVPVWGYFAACACTPVIWAVMTGWLAFGFLRSGLLPCVRPKVCAAAGSASRCQPHS